MGEIWVEWLLDMDWIWVKYGLNRLNMGEIWVEWVEYGCNMDKILVQYGWKLQYGFMGEMDEYGMN